MIISDLIYDVGMHTGGDTAFYLRKGFRVIGFEADPDSIAFCRKRFECELQTEKLIIVEGAITADASGRPIELFKNRKHGYWSTTVEKWAERHEQQGGFSDIIEVQPVNFANCLSHYGIPHYLKIDIEGADLVCLESLREVSGRPNFVSFESERDDSTKLAEEIDLLSELGYDHFQAIQQARARTFSEIFEESMSSGGHLEGGPSGLFGRDLPEKWLDKPGILARYEQIFLMYRIFDGKSFLRRLWLSRYVLGALSVLLRRPLPGWYDTHARHKDVG
jgi:FkbM family methyltransferase